MVSQLVLSFFLLNLILNNGAPQFEQKSGSALAQGSARAPGDKLNQTSQTGLESEDIFVNSKTIHYFANEGDEKDGSGDGWFDEAQLHPQNEISDVVLDSNTGELYLDNGSNTA